MYVAGVAAARERHVTLMPSFDMKLETRLGGRIISHRAQEGLVCFYRTRGERIEDRVYILLVRFPSLPIRYTTSRKTSMDFGFRQKH